MNILRIDVVQIVFIFFYRTIGFKDIEKKKDVQSMSGEKIISYISSHPLFLFEEIYKELL